MDTNQLLGGIGSFISLASTIPYIWLMVKGQVRPHLFSWFIWGLFNFIAGCAQMVEGGGPGAWVNFASAASTWGTAILGLFMGGTRDIARSDWYALAGVGIATIPWALTDDPLWSVILITTIDMMAFYPTFRKGWVKPHEDMATSYAISAIKHVLGLMALNVYNITTMLFPASLVLTNSLFVAMLCVRRRMKRKEAT